MLSTHKTSTDLISSPEKIETGTSTTLSVGPITFPKEENGHEVKYNRHPFQNWGGSVESSPAYTFFPKTKTGIRNIVTWASYLTKNVRVVGYKHTWTDFYPQDNDILISYKTHEGLLTPSMLDKTNEMEHIELVGEEFKEGEKIKHLCKIGAATSNEQFRTWAVNSFLSGDKKHCWALPLNVILVENTFGGTNAMMCHGAGWHNKTLSDLVTEIEFVDPMGNLRTIGYKMADPEEKQVEGKQLIKSAAGAFGLLGPVTAITYKLDLMTHARMFPVAPRLALTVPPPPSFEFPEEFPEEVMRGVTTEQVVHAQKDFIFRCENHYYSEWFWFSLHDKGWINSFDNNGAPEDSKTYPGSLGSTIQEVEQFIAGVANKSLMQFLPPKVQALLVSDAAMLLLPSGEEMVMPLPDALHFRRGIDEMQVNDMEFEIPIPVLPNGKPDWSICQRAWWDAVVTVYEWLRKKGKVPMRLPLEMRIMSGSDITMAAQKDNRYGTCSIEVLTLGTGLVDKEEWHAFMQAITDKWMAYTDFNDKPLNTRPHWAKQSAGLTIQRKGEERKDILTYLKEDAYKDAIPVFKRDLNIIAEKGKYSFDKMKMFSTPLLNYLFFDDKKPSVDLERKTLSLPKPELTSHSSISSAPREASELEAMTQLCKLRDKACDAHASRKLLLVKREEKLTPEKKETSQSTSSIGLFKASTDDSKTDKCTTVPTKTPNIKKKTRFCCF